MSSELLMPVPGEYLEGIWTDVLVERIRGETHTAEAGHCVRIEALPRPVLEQFTARAVEVVRAGVEVYLVDESAGPERWRVGVHRVVQRRNDEDENPVVVAVIPPDVRLAAGDSVDVSTFRRIATEELFAEVQRRLLESMPSRVQADASQVLGYLKDKHWPVSDSQVLDFLASVAVQGGDASSVRVGGSLYTLGLIPDFELFGEVDQFRLRLGLTNIPRVGDLSDQTRSPAETIVALPLAATAAEFRRRLLEADTAFRLRDVRRWGEAAATQAGWRDLALERWPLAEPPRPIDVRIDVHDVRLPRRRDDGFPILERAQGTTVTWQTTPAPLDVPGLEYFRVELVTSDRTVAWETPLIRRGTGASARRSRRVRDLSDVEEGVYFFRVVALNAAGDEIGQHPPRDPEQPEGKQTNETDDFLVTGDADVGEDDVEPTARITVAGYPDAEFRAGYARARTGSRARSARVEWLTPHDAGVAVAGAAIQFDVQREYVVYVGQRLRRLEEALLAAPRDLAHCLLDVGAKPSEPEPVHLAMPQDFEKARTTVFEAIRSTELQGDDGQGITVLADLCSLAPEIEAYAEAYCAWLADDDPRALLLDVVLASFPEGGRLALVAPTHPLRLVWLLQEHELARAWLKEALARTPVPDVSEAWRTALSPTALPALLVLDTHEAYLDAGPLPGAWGTYVPVSARDTRALLALAHARLGTGRMHAVEADLPPRLLTDKLELLLRQHPYTPALVLNVVNPGDGALVLESIVELEKRRRLDPPIRYEIRLFSERTDLVEVGSALRELADPDRQVSEEAAALMAPGESFLFPRLAWSRRPLNAFTRGPEAFPAHATIVLDAFALGLRVVRRDATDRSSFVHGLVQDPPRRAVGRGRTFAWVKRPAPTSGVELPGAPARSALIARMLVGLGSAAAGVLAPGSETAGMVGVAALELGPADQGLLYSAHAVSTWVLTVDPYLGLDYFDARGDEDRRGYLLDFTPEFVASGGRQLLLTTRAGDEIDRLMRPALAELAIEGQVGAAELLVEALRSLSGRLALKLLSAPTQVTGALGMALTRLVLEAYDVLDQAVLIPLDAHPELTRASPVEPNLRGDLLVVTFDMGVRALDALVIETKCMRGDGLPSDLRTRIGEQVRSSEAALREAFDPEFASPDRIDRAIQTWRLTTVLSFYLERAVRYGIVSPERIGELRGFLHDLEAGYSLRIRKMGLVFRLDAESSPAEPDLIDPEVPIWVIGRDVFCGVIVDALRRFPPRGEADADESQPARGRLALPTLSTHPSWQALRSQFRRAAAVAPDVSLPGGRDGEPVATATDLPSETDTDEGASTEPNGTRPPGSTAATDGRVPLEAPEPDVLLGETRITPQFALLGAPTAEPARRVAVDLDGCNTLSVFGVQGAGKSYTLGALVESALTPIPGLNRLPHPLGAVVFHYHQTQDYPPEFVAMGAPNDDPEERANLEAWGGAPIGVPDVLVLTTRDMLEYRRREFPNVSVEPIAFASAELTAQDWRFLMGATGSDSLYLQLLNEIMRKARGALTLDAIRHGIEGSAMSSAQRQLAASRLELAERFIEDGVLLRSVLRPGRLVVVDVRDEFIEKEQALGLFVTMLNVFSGAGMADEPFNKLIVFDEAHKYMGAGPLINHVVDVIRQMRHKGVSVTVASQDPINVPPAIIELSSVVCLHRFNSPNWLKHIQRSVAALTELTPQMLQALDPGEAFMWASKATDPAFTRRAVRVRVRPRATKHGGSTRRASQIADQ